MLDTIQDYIDRVFDLVFPFVLVGTLLAVGYAACALARLAISFNS